MLPGPVGAASYGRGVELSVLAPIATLGVAVVALFVGLQTIRQRDLADRREQWWERFRWASGLTLGEDEQGVELGLEVLTLLATSRLTGPEDLEVLEAGLTAALDRRPDLLDDGRVEGEDDGDDRQQGDGRSGRG